LGSYADRSDAVCVTFPARCKDVSLKKKPTEYLRQVYVDSIVFTPEALRHLVATVGAGQVMVGTDFGFPWVTDPVGHVLATPDLSSADKVAILGGTASHLLRLPG
jgi:aminocarboxymuconate-semialdehyde decarboxylase